MKNNLLKYNLTALVIFVAAAICPAQKPPMVGGYKETPKTDEMVVAAAKFAVETQAEKDGSLKLTSIERAEKQIVAGSNYKLCLVVNAQNGRQEATAVIYRNLQNDFSLTSWTGGKCSTSKSETSKPISEKDLAGVWDYGGDLNKFIINGDKVQRVTTEPSESSIKDYGIKAGEIDFVGVIQNNVIKRSQTLFVESEFRLSCPGLFNTKIKNEITLSKDGKTLTIVRKDPFLELDNCWWKYEGREPVVETMTKK